MQYHCAKGLGERGYSGGMRADSDISFRLTLA